MSENPLAFEEREAVEREQRELKAKLKQEQRAADVRALMELPLGRRFVFGELQRRGVYSSTFHETPTIAAFSEGRRSSGLELMQEVSTLTPQLFLVMLREAQND